MSRYSSNLCSRCLGRTFTPRIKSDHHFLPEGLLPESVLPQEEADSLMFNCGRDLDDYEAELSQLRTRVSFVEQQVERLKKYRPNVRCLASTRSIQKLPNELLASIFDYVCDWNLLQEFPWLLEKKLEDQLPTAMIPPVISYTPALLLGAICSKFRAISLSLPDLWSRLEIEITSEDSEVKATKLFLDFIDLFISRSKDSPLDIKLCIRGEPRYTPIALKRLTNQSYRWKSFTYHSKSEYPLGDYFGSNRSFPILEMLDVWHEDAHMHEPGEFQRAPKLKKLRVYHLTDSACLPWDQITHIELDQFSEQLAKILEMCPNLVSLKMGEWFDASELVPVDEPRISKHLRILKVTTNNYETPHYLGLFSKILSSFTFPALSHLIVTSYERYTSPWPIQSFTSFISRSSCEITTLDLQGYVGLSDAELILILRLLPSLEVLKLGEFEEYGIPEISPISTILIHSLTVSTSGNKSPLVPRLHTLGMVYHDEEFDDEAFICMVSSRWNCKQQLGSEVATDISRLRVVTVVFVEREVDEAVYKPLQDLERMGMRVIVRGREVNSESEDDDEGSEDNSEDDEVEIDIGGFNDFGPDDSEDEGSW